MEGFSEVPVKARGAGISALIGYFFNAQMEIGEKRLRFFQTKLSQAAAEMFACLQFKEVLKTRAAEAHLCGNLPNPQTVHAATLDHSKSAENP